MHEVAVVQPCCISCNQMQACLTVVCTYISHFNKYKLYLRMKMESTQSCVFSVMRSTCEMYFYFSQRLGKLPCGGSIAIDSSGMVIAE